VSTKDPLAGMRQAINDGSCTTLTWPRESKTDPCPVKPEETFNLRDCTIEITRIERTHHRGKRMWVALFTRYPRRADRRLLLAANGDGYTSDEKRALGLGETLFDHAPETLDLVGAEDRSVEHRNAGEPLEPEAIPHAEVLRSSATAEAHQRFVLELGAERVAEQEQPLEVRLARLRAKSRGRNVDISRELYVIEKRIKDAEQKLERHAA
jgi:hypothetical protein